MDQTELEKHVQRLFERQGFEVEKEGNRLKASEEGIEKSIQVFSSDEFSETRLEEQVEPENLVFVDEQLSGIKARIDNEVSVIEEEDEAPEYDLPSYEVIGDVVVINEMNDNAPEEVVEGILEYNPHVETILVKDEPLSGEYRLGEYEKLYGEETETVHTEFGCRYRVDPTKVYFSERFGTERKRVIDQVEDGEKPLVIGAGVGPFAVLAARHANPEKVVAVEKNPAAVEYLEENIELNGVGDTVEALEADARDIDLGEKFDRVIIPIPEMADEFLGTAFEHISDDGTIHYYRFMEGEDWSDIEQEIERIKPKNIDHEILDRVRCGDRGPEVSRVCTDIHTMFVTPE